MNLNRKAMLVGLSISQWGANRQDKGAGKRVSDDYGNQQDSARVYKSLIAKDAIKKVSTVANEARTFLYANTLPWKDDGKRILPAANFLPLTAEIRTLEAKFWGAVSDLEANYPSLVQDAKLMLNGLFNALDYPKVEEIREKYAFSVSVDPLPTGDDFRVDLQGEEVTKIQKEIEDRLQNATQDAMRELWGRLYKATESMVDRLSDPEAIFRDSLITNLEELVSILPRLNMTDDPELEKMRREVEEKLIKDPAVLRTDKDERKQTADEAKAILDSMAAFMGQ